MIYLVYGGRGQNHFIDSTLNINIVDSLGCKIVKFYRLDISIRNTELFHSLNHIWLRYFRTSAISINIEKYHICSL